MTDAVDWRPTAPIANLRRRSDLLRRVRRYFDSQGLLEVETPMLSAAAATDPALASARVTFPGEAGVPHYLQTSPEFPMKRLLAAGSGPIWQICRVVRGDERGRRHNPEFTMLEWYRPGWDHHRLMADVVALIGAVLDTTPGVRKRTYAEVFAPLAVDPHEDSSARLRDAAAAAGIDVPDGLDRDGLLDLLLSHCITPTLGRDGIIDLLHAFPASQAALARLEPDSPATAARFECFLNGMEIANGFHELTDAAEQERRFRADLARRRRLGHHIPAMDQHLLASLRHGLPDCAGVALGLDRLFMVAMAAERIDEVLAFPIERA